MIVEELKKKIVRLQRNEISEHIIYMKLSRLLKDREKAAVLEKISRDELAHHDFWRELSAQYVEPDRLKIFFFVWVSRLFGLTFGLKLLEKGEENAQDVYANLKGVAAGVVNILQDEESHEHQLIDMIDEERLLYVSSVVLGLNDALVELTGALVGFSFALQKAKLVAVVGLITGIAASLSMAASEYLSTRQEETKKDPVKASVYTGIAYVLTVTLLIMPYLFLDNVYACVAVLLAVALSIVFVFTYYVSVAKGVSLKHRFVEMAGIGLGVAAINFGIGIAVRRIFGIDL
ncbi:MAG: VIT1/CCC1 transporter family protein [Candidatus Omnitrophica bacterium]|nr:VIT1/CCC1 transporter family protein [Candidatus Omnitrophota bacterium]